MMPKTGGIVAEGEVGKIGSSLRGSLDCGKYRHALLVYALTLFRSFSWDSFEEGCLFTILVNGRLINLLF